MCLQLDRCAIGDSDELALYSGHTNALECEVDTHKKNIEK